MVGGGSAYPRIFDFVRMRAIADACGALLLIDMAHFAGLVAGGVHPSPVPHAHIVTTTTHKTLRGPRAGMILSRQEFAAPIDKVVFPGVQGGPLVHFIAAKAVCFREAMRPDFRDYARQIIANAKVLAQTLADAGFRVISGGTDTHLMLIDVFSRGMLGSEAEKALGEGGITVNKNAIPFDTNPPMKPSGIRIGTPAVTTRGMREAEMRQIGRWIAQALARLDAENEYLLLGPAEVFLEFDGLPPNFVAAPLAWEEDSPRSVVEFDRVMRRAECDVVHIPYLFWYPRRTRCPYVVTVHDLLTYYQPNSNGSHLKRILHNYLTRRALGHAARILAVSKFTKNDLCRVYGVRPESIE